jgi:hypothetical protein
MPRTRHGIACLAVAGAAVGLAALVQLLTTGTALPLEDFVEYWAAGRLTARGDNPYDAAILYAMERPVSAGLSEAIMMWNPPWTLTVAIPFGVLPVHFSHLLWLWMQMTVLVACADWLWHFYGGAKRLRWLGWLVALAFLPSYFLLHMGQISSLVLLGIVGILMFDRHGRQTDNYRWMGAAALLAAIKPHMVLLLGVVLVWQALEERRWSFLRGCVWAVLAGMVLPLACNPMTVNQYMAALVQHPPHMLSPTLGSLLRLAFGMDRFYLQFIPALVGIGWLVYYRRRRRHAWDWGHEMPLVLLMSFLTASYGAWPFDLVVLLVPVLRATVWLTHDRRPNVIGFAAVAFVGFDVLAWLFRDVPYTEQYWNVWMTPLLLYVYLALQRQTSLVAAEADDVGMGPDRSSPKPTHTGVRRRRPGAEIVAQRGGT